MFASNAYNDEYKCGRYSRKETKMGNKCTILLVEDDKNVAGFITTILTANQYKVEHARTGNEAKHMAATYCPNLIILDLGLPDMDGMDVLVSLRTWTQTPVIVVSARSSQQDKVKALDLGADDYVTKPFGTGELLARVRTALRHARNAEGRFSPEIPAQFRSGDLLLDFDKRRVMLDGKNVHLTQTEYNIVTLLARNAGRVLTYDTIIRSIWGPNSGTDNQILRVNMANIRRKMEQNPGEPKYIFTEMGVGYRMVESEI